jgi:hypothetical protein
VDPHCFDADPDPDPAQNLYADPDPDLGGGEGVGQPKMCIPPANPRYAPDYNIFTMGNPMPESSLTLSQS